MRHHRRRGTWSRQEDEDRVRARGKAKAKGRIKVIVRDVSGNRTKLSVRIK